MNYQNLKTYLANPPAQFVKMEQILCPFSIPDRFDPPKNNADCERMMKLLPRAVKIQLANIADTTLLGFLERGYHFAKTYPTQPALYFSIRAMRQLFVGLTDQSKLARVVWDCAKIDSTSSFYQRWWDVCKRHYKRERN